MSFIISHTFFCYFLSFSNPLPRNKLMLHQDGFCKSLLFFQKRLLIPGQVLVRKISSYLVQRNASPNSLHFLYFFFINITISQYVSYLYSILQPNIQKSIYSSYFSFIIFHYRITSEHFFYFSALNYSWNYISYFPFQLSSFLLSFHWFLLVFLVR